MNININYIIKSILAGMCIGLAGCSFLNVGGLPGACLFAFGLIAVITMGLNLYTGKAQLVWSRSPKEFSWLFSMLLLNFLGCLLAALCFRTPELSDKAAAILSARLAKGTLQCGILSLFCGAIMTLAVQSAAKKNWLPLIFGIPTFIMCGLPHCVADAYYICMAPTDFLTANVRGLIPFYLAIVLGNYLGCNAYRLVNVKAEKISAPKNETEPEKAQNLSK